MEGYIYHMVSIHNLPSIFTQKAILSKQRLDQMQIFRISIANEEVQQLRSRIFVFDAGAQTYRSLHSYVPLYFAKHTPMLHVQYTNGLQENIVIFEVSRAILTIQGVIFTDGNATLQQLSKMGTEKVGIIPATVDKPFCQRTYKPDNRPLGTNTNRSDFYSDVTFLHRLNWNIINDKDYNRDERKRIGHAEALIPDYVPLSKIEAISVSTLHTEQRVNMMIQSHGLQNDLPAARYKSELFF
jgi:hypothetical protein